MDEPEILFLSSLLSYQKRNVFFCLMDVIPNQGNDDRLKIFICVVLNTMMNQIQMLSCHLFTS